MADGYCATDIPDAELNQIRSTVNYIYVCSGNPQTFAQATTNKLAERAIDYYSFTDPAEGSDGRIMTLSAQSGLTVSVSGYAHYICLVNTSTAALRISFRKSLAKYVSAGTTMDIAATSITSKYQTIVS